MTSPLSQNNSQEISIGDNNPPLISKVSMSDEGLICKPKTLFPDTLKSPLEQAQEIRKYSYMPDAQGKAQTLLDTCEWITEEEGWIPECEKAISICKEILK